MISDNKKGGKAFEVAEATTQPNLHTYFLHFQGRCQENSRGEDIE